METGLTVGFKALARWMDPLRGAILPEEFLPLADETGLIVAIDRAVMAGACNAIVSMQAAAAGSLPFVSVNISPRSLQQPDLIAVVRDILHQSGLAPPRLQVEITEGSLIGSLADGAPNWPSSRSSESP
jgi:EAL domain-containing protein (putative c-di-GMP-specific phosphodiesterase class I)